jgi:hypothetical protein
VASTIKQASIQDSSTSSNNNKVATIGATTTLMEIRGPDRSRTKRQDRTRSAEMQSLSFILQEFPTRQVIRYLMYHHPLAIKLDQDSTQRYTVHPHLTFGLFWFLGRFRWDQMFYTESNFFSLRLLFCPTLTCWFFFFFFLDNIGRILERRSCNQQHGFCYLCNK